MYFTSMKKQAREVFDLVLLILNVALRRGNFYITWHLTSPGAPSSCVPGWPLAKRGSLRSEWRREIDSSTVRLTEWCMNDSCSGSRRVSAQPWPCFTRFSADTWGAFVEKRKKIENSTCLHALLEIPTFVVLKQSLCRLYARHHVIMSPSSCQYLISAQSEGKWTPELLRASWRTEIRTLQHSRQSVSELKDVDARCGWILIRAAHTLSNRSELTKKHNAGDAGKMHLDSILESLKLFSPLFYCIKIFWLFKSSILIKKVCANAAAKIIKAEPRTECITISSECERLTLVLI